VQERKRRKPGIKVTKGADCNRWLERISGGENKMFKINETKRIRAR